MLGLELYEAGVCECGHHSSLTNDRDNYFTFEDRKCLVCAGVARYARLRAKQDEQADEALGESPPPHTARASDGRRTSIRMLSPLEVSERRESASTARVMGQAHADTERDNADRRQQ